QIGMESAAPVGMAGCLGRGRRRPAALPDALAAGAPRAVLDLEIQASGIYFARGSRGNRIDRGGRRGSVGTPAALAAGDQRPAVRGRARRTAAGPLDSAAAGAAAPAGPG